MAMSDKQLASVMLLLLAGIGAFRHWPLFLLEQKLEAAAQAQQNALVADRHLWWCAGIVLEHYREFAR